MGKIAKIKIKSKIKPLSSGSNGALTKKTAASLKLIKS